MAREASLLFAFEVPADDSREAMGLLVATLNEERLWSRGPIEFVDETDTSSVSQPGDQPIRTVGGVLRLRRVEDSPVAIEQAQLEDIAYLIGRLRVFTADAGPVAIEYDGEEIGTIANGQVDRSLRVGLLGESH